MIHTLKFAEACPTLGITRIDLGKGTEAYKRSLASGATQVAEGSVDSRPVVGAVRRGLVRTRQWIRTSPLEPSARRIMRTIRSFRKPVCACESPRT